MHLQMKIWLEDASIPNKFKKPSNNSDFVEHLKKLLDCLFDDLHAKSDEI